LGLKLLLAGFVWMIATRQLVMEGDLSGRPTECRYCRYPAPKGRCCGNHFLAFYIWGAHCWHLANTTEPSMCSADSAVCQTQITLTTCYNNSRPGPSSCACEVYGRQQLKFLQLTVFVLFINLTIINGIIKRVFFNKSTLQMNNIGVMIFNRGFTNMCQ